MLLMRWSLVEGNMLGSRFAFSPCMELQPFVNAQAGTGVDTSLLAKEKIFKGQEGHVFSKHLVYCKHRNSAYGEDSL